MMHPPIEERYQETLDWIYSWVDFSMKRHVDDKHRFFKLDRMNQLMELLDFPHHKFPSVHVTGQGKRIDASLIASHYKRVDTRLALTLPHLEIS
jgi:folylpolyglutamate synthase/dihydropteroate synthase